MCLGGSVHCFAHWGNNKAAISVTVAEFIDRNGDVGN
jgi:hypothetical protein